MPVIYRIFIPGRVENQNGVKFQAFRILYRKYQDTICKLCGFQITFHDVHEFAQLGCSSGSSFPVTADDCYGAQTPSLPISAQVCRLSHHRIPICKLLDGRFFSMTNDGLHRIDGELSVMQDIRSKIGNLHGITVAFLQNAEAVHGIWQIQFFQFFPIIQAVTKVDILRNVPHDGVSAVLDTALQYTVGHHAEVLRFVDNHMTCFLNDLRFFYTLIEVGQGCQVVYVQGVAGYIYIISPLNLSCQKLLIQFKNRFLPNICTIFAPVSPQNSFLFRFCIFHPFA